MFLLRTTLSVFVALAIAVAPLAAAWGKGATTSEMVAAVEKQPVNMILQDCASMMQDVSQHTCCGQDKACPSDLCVAKCFQFFGTGQQSRNVVPTEVARFHPAGFASPPDWRGQPHLRPPRS